MSTRISPPLNGNTMSSGSLAIEQLEQCVRTACSEMGRQWREGRPVLAEDILAQMPELAEHSELALELIYTEYVVRDEVGQQCTNQQWFARFPQWTNDLMQLLEVHRQLCEAETVQTAGNKWQELSTAGSTADSRDLHEPRSTDSFGRTSRSRQASDDQIGRLVGNYQLLEELGRGGMGVVYRARQLNLNRDVALKMILSGEFASPREMNRFQAEAQSTARLHHPNIVQIYEVGAHQQRPFLSMELITGGNLDSRLKSGLPSPEHAAQLLHTICTAVHYAHLQGIIHRDLKPCNVLLDEHEHPKVADFGLAKQLQEGHNECSRSMGPVGTPSYMAPETVGGAHQKVTPATDVYSLGVILYEMLTGKPPFVAETQLETMRQIVNEEPASLSVVNKRVPRDLETICLKCLQKDPRRRYPTAAELADELQRYLKREPIRAKPVGALERCYKWTRRRPLEATFIAFLLISFFGILGLWRAAVASDFKARLAADRAVKHRDIAEVEKAHAQRNEYFLRIGQAHGEYLSNMVGRANELLDECPQSMRHFEWNFLKRRCSAELVSMKGHKDLLCVMAVTRDGNYAATGSGEWGWNWPGDIIIWNLRTGRETVTITPNEGPIMALDFSPDGQFLASSSYPWDGLKSPGVKIWNMQGELVWRLPHPAQGSKSIKFSPDGRRLAVAWNKQVQIWDVKLRKLIRVLPGHEGMILDIAFDPSGTRLATVGRDGTAAIYDWVAQKRTPINQKYGDLRWVRFSPDGRYLTFSNYGPSIWRVDLTEYLSGKENPAFPNTHYRYEIGAIESFEYSPEGRRIGVCSNDGSVLIVNAADGQVLQKLYTHNGMVRNLYFTEDNRIVTAASEGTVKVWDLSFDKPIDQIDVGAPADMGSVSRLRFTRDGNRILIPIVKSHSWGKGKKLLLVYDLKTLENVLTLQGHTGNVTDVAESPDSAYLATSSQDKTVRIWDATIGKPVNVLSYPSPVNSLRIDSTGQLVIAACADGTVHVRQWQSGETLLQWQAHQGAINEIDLSSDGDLLATAGDDHVTRVWNLTSGQAVYELLGHSDRVLALTFSHGGHLLATASVDQTIKLWSLSSGQEVRTLRAHIRQVNDLDFSSDDKRLVSCGREWIVKVWDVESGQEAISFRERGMTSCVAFHPSDELIVCSCERQVQLYDARSREHDVPDTQFATSNHNWNMDQAKSARTAGLTDVARINFARVSELNPTNEFEYRRRGHSRATLERWPEAIADLSKAYGLGSKAPDLLHSLAIANLANNDLQQCRHYSSLLIEKAIETYNSNALTGANIDSINNAIFDAILVDQRPERAESLLGIMEDILVQGKRLGHNIGPAENTLALLYYRCGWMAEAEALMERRPHNHRAYADDWACRSLLAAYRGDVRQAQMCLDKATSLCHGSLLDKQTNLKVIHGWQFEFASRLLIRQAQRKLAKLQWRGLASGRDVLQCLVPSQRPLLRQWEPSHWAIWSNGIGLKPIFSAGELSSKR